MGKFSEDVVDGVKDDIKKQWDIIKENNKLSVEKKIQKIIKIPIKDVKNIIRKEMTNDIIN